ncbi:MAG: NADP-specific glutamate dehydrogenase [Candidatus Nomurabacteria bacterium]|jgi:glutamate dehydrogenase (NADP+)|nr:NADP-specific glutamate dehydrogenase [Candidatus Nomurabacteria bacterium]
MLRSKYAKSVYAAASAGAPHQPEFLQAVHEVFESIEPVLRQNPEFQNQAILERLIEPDRQIIFRVAWTDDRGRVNVNRGWRIEFNNALGPYKGGLRFHLSVNTGIVKFLGFEQIFKNSLTGLWLGGGKGGSDFDPRGRSDGEVMRFCQSFMSELYRHIGATVDVPAGDVGVGEREIGYLFGQYKRLTRDFSGVLTGKKPDFGGSLARPEATGYGLCYLTAEVLRLLKNDSFADKTVAISGSGNVAIFAAEKAAELGAKVLTMSDSGGYIYDPNGVHLGLVKEIKLQRRGRIAEYVKNRAGAKYVANKKAWQVPCDIALPCATQNELVASDARQLVKNGCQIVAEGANMPTAPDAVKILRQNDVIFAPAKAANAGGVAVSALEMAQGAGHLAWDFATVDARLQEIMIDIVGRCLDAAARHDRHNDLAAGANIAGFERVARAMLDQGIV